MPLHVVNHPVAAHLLAILRDKRTEPSRFRQTCHHLTHYLLAEATRALPTRQLSLDTPLERTTADMLCRGVVAVPILRAGLAMLEPVVNTLPDVTVGYVGLERDEETAEPHAYYCKLPSVADQHVLLLDPMLATGGSVIAAMNRLEEHGARDVTMICIVSAPEGVEQVEQAFPSLPIFTASLDSHLDENKYIRPGLGDFGDRLYGT